MKLILREYNVTPNIEERDEFIISLSDNKLLYNNKEILDDNKLRLIVDLINKYKGNIYNLKNERIQNFKGGRQKTIGIQFDDSDEVYSIIGNTPSEESTNLYNYLKSEIIKIIEG